MQSIKLLKVQAKEREASEQYEQELEKIIQRAEIVDKTTKEYTQEQRDTISQIDKKDGQLKESAKIYENEVQREEEEKRKIAETTKKINEIESEIVGLEYFFILSYFEYRKKGRIVARGINKMKRIKEFLEEVANSREEFDKKIEAVKNRFDSLRSGTKELKRSLELLDKKLEQEKLSSDQILEDLKEKILLEQNKRPGIMRQLEAYEKEINLRSDKEKQSNESLIRKHKEYTQIRLAIDHLYDFICRFRDITASEDPKLGKTGANKFHAPVQQQQEKGGRDKAIEESDEILELKDQITKLKFIEKESQYWQELYGNEAGAFKKEQLYEEIKAKKKPITDKLQSPKKKSEAMGGGQTKETFNAGVTNSDVTKKLTNVFPWK